MGKHKKARYRSPFGGKIISLILCATILFNAVTYAPVVSAEESMAEVESEQIVIEETAVEEATIVEPIIEPETEAEPEYVEEIIEEHTPVMEHDYNGKRLTKRGGVYQNPYTGLKETWYSQKVLPGGGLKIPGRHVNEEGFVCDGDGYICVASSTYPKGTVIETSRGMGKVYDSGCAPGILDIYTNW